jgi:hypothetical protein
MTLTEFIDAMVDEEFIDFMRTRCIVKGIDPDHLTISEDEWLALRAALSTQIMPGRVH